MNPPPTLKMRSLRFPLRSLRLCVEQHLSNCGSPLAPKTTAAFFNTMRKSKFLNPWAFSPNCAIRRCFYRSYLPQLTEISNIRLWNFKCTR